MVLILIFQNLLINCKECYNTKKQVIQYGKAEIKILCIVCYYVGLAIFILLTLTYFEATHDAQLEALMEFTEYNLPGFHSDELESGDSGIPYVRLQWFYVLSAIGILQVILIPVVILVFTVRCTGKFHCHRKRQTDTAQGATTSYKLS